MSAPAAPAARPPWRALVVTGALALGLLASGTSGTRSDWTTATTVGTGSARSGSLAIGHSYQAASCSQGQRASASVECSGSLAPTVAASTPGVSATDTITNSGTLGAARLGAEVRAASCAPVKLDNKVAAANPLLPRHGTTFHTTGGPMDSAGFVTLDGGNPGGYATSVVASTQPGSGLVSAGTLSGVGVWFKAAPGATGPIFSFAAPPANGAGDADRALYLDGAGRLNLIWNLSGSKIGPSGASYADGAWHFAYVTFGGVVLVGLIPQVTLWVDGLEQAKTPLIALGPMSSYSGYWHLGWAPTAVTGEAAYGAVSLSNFVVDNVGAIPSGSTIGKPATQASFDSSVGTVSDHWLLADPGTTTFGGTVPTTMIAPCSKVDLSWTFSNPSATATTTTPLATLADGSWRSVAAPGPGGSQTSTITVSRGADWHSDLSGLRLRVPLSYRVQPTPAGSPWVQTFTWSGAEGVFIA